MAWEIGDMARLMGCMGVDCAPLVKSLGILQAEKKVDVGVLG